MARVFFKHMMHWLAASMLPLTVLAQDIPALHFKKIDEQNGLSDNYISCIYKDRKGLLWIGTQSGLNLLDGSEISNLYNAGGQPPYPGDPQVNCIAEGRGDQLWVGCRNGLNCLNVPSRSWSHIRLDADSAVPDKEVLSLALNKRGNLYIGSGSGLYLYNINTQQVARIPIPDSGALGRFNIRIGDLRFDENGLLWIASGNGLWNYDERAKRMTPILAYTDDPDTRPVLCTRIIFGKDGNLYLGTWDRGLIRYNPVTAEKTVFELPLHAANIFSMAEISTGSGSAKVALNCGLLFFDEQTKKFEKPSNVPEGIRAVYYSDQQRLWVGTENGLYYCTPFISRFNTVYYPHSVTGQGIAIAQLKDRILVGAGGKYFLREYNEQLRQTANIGEAIKEDSNNCLSISIASPKQIRCGTMDGIIDINLTNFSAHRMLLPKPNPAASPVSFITAIHKDRMGKWWIFPWRHGVWQQQDHGPPVQIFSHFISDKPASAELVVNAACEDAHSNIWMSDYDNGIVLYDRKRNRFSLPFQKSKISLCEQILCYRDHCFTFNYTSVLEWQVDSIRLHVLPIFPAVDKKILSIAVDSSDHLWLATVDQLIAYDLNTGHSRQINLSDGIPGKITYATLYCLANGTMLLGTADYLAAFRPEALLSSSSKVPLIHVTQVRVDGKVVPFMPDRHYHFDAGTHNFTFKWAVDDFNDPLNNKYYFKLEGTDTAWRYAGKSGSVEFANLYAGHYSLLLRGMNSNGVTADRILHMNFDIAPPFWRTLWFAVAVILLLATSFYVLYRFRLMQVLRLEKLRNKISTDLHDDIGSTLSSISILSEMALNRNGMAERDMIREIKDNSINLMERMDDIVWAVNPQNDFSENLFLRLRTFAARIFEAKGIAYEISVAEALRHIHLDMELRQHLYLMAKEAVNNLVKHSGATQAGISATATAGEVHIVVWDNGRGFDTKVSCVGNGIRNLKTRAERCGAAVTIESGAGAGTRISIIAKIK